MSDFVPGDVLETRRGGVDVLRHLARELATLERNGSIQILRNIPDVGQRTGHLLIFDGSLAAAFHSADTDRYGIEALLEIESDASALDATMSLHEMSESSYISTLSEHPDANLIASDEETRDEAWWTTVRSPRRRSERDERLPELKPSVGVPEALRRRSEARLRNQGGPVLQRGQAWLEHSIEPDEVFEFAGALGKMEQPFLVISRLSPPRIESSYDIDLQHYRWLSETQHEYTLEPSLESIRLSVDQFFAEHRQSVLILEGIEYLSGIHGEQRVIEMIRSIVDQTRMNGNILIISSNLEAFTSQHRSRLEREFSILESHQLQTWLLDVELLQEHPYFSNIDEELEATISEHLEANVHDPVLPPKPELHTPVEQVPLPVEHQTMKIDEELQSKMRSWASDDAEDSDEEVEIETETLPTTDEVKVEVKPRTAQRIVRKRKQVIRTSKQNSIDAAAKRNVVIPPLSENVSARAKPFVPNSAEIAHTLPEPKIPRKRIVIPLPITEQSKEESQPSPHAREHAVSRQRASDEPDSEDSA